MDQFLPNGKSLLVQLPAKDPQDHLSPTMSYSAGTFYDCVSTCSQLETPVDASEMFQKNLTNEITRMCAMMVAQSDELANVGSPDVSFDVPISIPGFLSPEEEHYQQQLHPHLSATFISKTPSPSAGNFMNHYQLYMSKSQGDAREMDSTTAFASGSELTEIEAPSSGPISRSNSKKKKGIRFELQY